MAVMILAALGPALNGIPWIPVVDGGAWVSGEPFLPEWEVLRQELTTIPVGLNRDLAAFGEWSENSWASVSHWLSAFGRGFSPWVWALFILCGAAACALDGMEWMARRMNRTGR
ncbi:MAG: hypothetical protein IT368_02870 [Candidatus Hydrogenedentes bacterium]|nr:hypothetical protein [Candidatus Hydrogenedentota bacterium]